MTLTLEVRWFGSSPLPDVLREWFSALGTVRTAEQTDLYLPAEDPAFNLKLRDDQLQIKRRLAGPFRTSLGPNAAGRCEEWVKWSFQLEEVASLWDEDPTSLWMPVEKTRHQLTIPPETQSSLTSDLPTSPPASIEAELTTLEADHKSAWTLCIEADGPARSLVKTLTTAAPLLLDDRLPISLSSDQSFGYIRWLQQLPTVDTRPAPEIRISPPQ
jgi:hypothetical protein